MDSRAAWHLRTWLSRAMHDALAATALLRVAVAVAEDGPADGLARCRDLIAAAPMLLADDAAARANRRVPGLLGIPARPGCYLRQIDERLSGRRRDRPVHRGVRAATAGPGRRLRPGGARCRTATCCTRTAIRAAAATWRCGHLHQWRAVAGYTDVRPPTDWEQPPLATGPTLAQRLRDSPGRRARRQVETPGDLLWYAELADALAQLHGHAAAVVTYDEDVPDVDYRPGGGRRRAAASPAGLGRRSPWPAPPSSSRSAPRCRRGPAPGPSWSTGCSPRPPSPRR